MSSRSEREQVALEHFYRFVDALEAYKAAQDQKSRRSARERVKYRFARVSDALRDLAEVSRKSAYTFPELINDDGSLDVFDKYSLSWPLTIGASVLPYDPAFGRALLRAEFKKQRLLKGWKR